MNNKSDISTYLILGYPRSGTTWFANLINTHPDVVYRHEIIGRCYKDFPDDLFRKLKYDYQLSDNDYRKTLNIILSPNVESDRAPFFSKRHLLISSPRLHYMLWIAGRTAPLLQPLYKLLYRPRGNKLSLVIKETRSTMNMDSVIQAIRSKKNIILFRHPCGAIASSLNGIKNGKMTPSTKKDRELWFNENGTRDFIKSLSPDMDLISDLPEHEYLALRWRQQNEDYLEFNKQNMDNIYIHYEDFMANQEKASKTLFERLSLNYDKSVKEFIQISSGYTLNKTIFKDSSSSYYSVYRSQGFNPNQWQHSLSSEEIAGINRYTLDICEALVQLKTL
jgi:hypothetical protein